MGMSQAIWYDVDDSFNYIMLLATASRPSLLETEWRVKNSHITVQKWQWPKWVVFKISWYAFGGW